MIHRKFDNLKFRRTYIGGSKQRENQIFTEVQGTKEDNSEVNWFEYRRVFTQYCDDTLNIILSWKYLSLIVSYIFLVIATLASFVSLKVSLIFLVFAIVSQLGFQYLKRKEKKNLSDFNYSLNSIHSEIKKRTGLEF